MDRLKGPKKGFGGVLLLARGNVELSEELAGEGDGEINWGSVHPCINL